MNPKLSIPPATFIVMPAYNEAAAIGDVIGRLKPIVPNIVVVDDGSEDDTGKVAGRAGALVLHHVINRGQGASLQTGIDFALRMGADYIVTFDSDGQHCEQDIADLLAPLVQGSHDIVLGSRFLGSARGMPWSRRYLLRVAVAFTRLTSGARITDTHNGLRALSREAAARIRITMDRMAHASEIIDQIVSRGLRYTEVPVHVRYTDYSRAKGQSSLGGINVLVQYVLAKVLG